MNLKREYLLEKTGIALREAEAQGASQTEVSISLVRMALTRLANSIIDQNVAENRASVRILLYFGKKKGSVSVDTLDDESIEEAVVAAAKMARVSREDTNFKSLPQAKPFSSALKSEELVCKTTAEATPEERANYAMKAIQEAHEIDKRISAVAGAISNQLLERVIANSLGVEGYQAGTSANVNLTILGRDGSDETAGWAEDNRRDFQDLQIGKVVEIAAGKAANGFGARSLKPGEYEAVLEASASANLALYMAYIGFSALSYQEYRSFLRDRIGEKVFSDKLHMWDDALDERFVKPRLFDSEGHPKKKMTLVDGGIVKNLMYDSYTAGKDNVESTGHNMRMWGTSLPFSEHMIMEEGKSDVDELIAQTKRGILVTHFHYTNPVDPIKGVLTGLTRDGTWYVENGEVKHPVGTLRYTDAIPRFLGEIDIMGRYPELNGGSHIFPSLKLPSFRITGSAEG
ncbi:MAG: TldD/PmbA family protein [Candidatus Thorarchaeota archaeon]|jgi:predicted Zn-dependent protease